MEVPRLRVKSERQLPAYTTATATAIQDLHHSSWQHWIFSEARDQTYILMDPSLIPKQGGVARFSA